jgi:hypothetical protein
LTVLMPGFYFDAAGNIVYMREGYDGYAKQQSGL